MTSMLKAVKKNPMKCHPDAPIFLREIYNSTCKLYGIPPNDLLHRTIHNHHLTGRWADIMVDIVGVMRTQRVASFPEIARAVGFRSHGSAQNSYINFCDRPPLEQADTCMLVRQEVMRQRKADVDG